MFQIPVERKICVGKSSNVCSDSRKTHSPEQIGHYSLRPIIGKHFFSGVSNIGNSQTRFQALPSPSERCREASQPPSVIPSLHCYTNIPAKSRPGVYIPRASLPPPLRELRGLRVSLLGFAQVKNFTPQTPGFRQSAFRPPKPRRSCHSTRRGRLAPPLAAFLARSIHMTGHD